MAETKWTNVTVVVDTAIYAANDGVGGMLTVTDDVVAKQTVLTDIILASDDTETPQFDVFFFDTTVGSGSTVADQAAFALAIADRQQIFHVEKMASYSADANGNTYVASGLAVPVKSAAGHSIFIVIVVRAGITFTATTDLRLRLGFATIN